MDPYQNPFLDPDLYPGFEEMFYKTSLLLFLFGTFNRLLPEIVRSFPFEKAWPKSDKKKLPGSRAWVLGCPGGAYRRSEGGVWTGAGELPIGDQPACLPPPLGQESRRGLPRSPHSGMYHFHQIIDYRFSYKHSLLQMLFQCLKLLLLMICEEAKLYYQK